MKKNVFGLAAMAVAVSMASCSLEEVMEQPAQQAIGFSTFVGKSTKAEIVGVGGTNGLTTFYVFGKYGDASGGTYTNKVFENYVIDNVTSTGAAHSTDQYWVANKKYVFAAYSNGNDKIETYVSFDDNGHITFTDYIAGEKDLILATAEKTTGATISDSDPSAVTLEFKHLLSQVAFEFKNGFTNGYKVAITYLKFNVNNKATYSYQGNAYSWAMKNPAESADKEYTINEGNPFDGEEANKTQTSAYEFVIPQSNKGITASFTVTVYDTDGATVVATKEYKDGNAVPLATGTTTTPGGDNNAWTPGYKYKYTATIDANVLSDVMFPIKFKVTSVDTWTDAAADDNFGLDLDGTN